MDGDDPDLQAFEFNLRRTLRERILGTAAALVSNLCQNASDPQSIGVSSKDNLIRIRRIHRMITKHPQNGSLNFEGHIYFEAGRWPAGKTYQDAVGAAVEEQYLPTVPVLVHTFLQFGGRTRRGTVETADSRLCTGKISEPTSVEKMDRSSCVGLRRRSGKRSTGRYSVAWNEHTWHAGENWSQEYRQIFAEPWETQRLSSMGNSVDLFRHRPRGPGVGWQRRPGRNSKRKIQGSGRGQRTARCDRIPVSPPRFIAADLGERGRLRVGGSYCGQWQARLRKTSYHSCDTDSVQE